MRHVAAAPRTRLAGPAGLAGLARLAGFGRLARFARFARPRVAAWALAVLCAITAAPARGWALPAAPTREAPGAASAEPGSSQALDRQTPRRTMEGFLKQARDGDFLRAASYLDLRAIPLGARDQDGPVLAQELAYFLQRQPSFDPGALMDDAEVNPADRGTYVAARLYAGEESVPIVLKR